MKITVWTRQNKKISYNLLMRINQMFLDINKYLIQLIEQWGYHAVSPQPVGMIDNTHIYSNWSQRHIAYAAGLGTFGVNNMLITDAGTCGLCVRRCPIHALDLKKPFDRNACASRLGLFEKRLGADACGKCTTQLPCTYHSPLKKL